MKLKLTNEVIKGIKEQVTRQIVHYISQYGTNHYAIKGMTNKELESNINRNLNGSAISFKYFEYVSHLMESPKVGEVERKRLKDIKINLALLTTQYIEAEELSDKLETLSNTK